MPDPEVPAQSATICAADFALPQQPCTLDSSVASVSTPASPLQVGAIFIAQAEDDTLGSFSVGDPHTHDPTAASGAGANADPDIGTATHIRLAVYFTTRPVHCSAASMRVVIDSVSSARALGAWAVPAMMLEYDQATVTKATAQAQLWEEAGRPDLALTGTRVLCVPQGTTVSLDLFLALARGEAGGDEDSGGHDGDHDARVTNHEPGEYEVSPSVPTQDQDQNSDRLFAFECARRLAGCAVVQRDATWAEVVQSGRVGSAPKGGVPVPPAPPTTSASAPESGPMLAGWEFESDSDAFTRLTGLEIGAESDLGELYGVVTFHMTQ
jgi:hypothetical protein